MTSRPKIFSEFMAGITIVHRDNGGIKIICKLKDYVLLESRFKPWNTPDMRKTFLANLYIKEVLLKINISKYIQRPEGFELLGKRVLYRDEVVVICSWKELVDKETGELTKILTLAGRFLSPAPFKTSINNVQL